MSKRVVVTGLGAVTPLGNNVETFWNNILAGKSGIAPITHFDTTHFDAKIAGEVKQFEPAPIVDRKDVKRMDLFVQYALVAAQEALLDS
jgi:3-oxoacyl-(acyl-carrier-protein) synthase